VNLEAPRTLPVDHLSHSSIATYLDCPERWRRRYLEREYEPTNGNMLIGKAVGRTITAGYLDKMKEGVVNLELIKDTFDTQWSEALEDEIVWEDEEDASEPGRIKDSALACLDEYAITLMQKTTPTVVEEGFEVVLPGTEWATVGYIDFIAGGVIHDTKTGKKRKTQNEIDRDPQGTLYVASKQLQTGLIQPFRWHAIKRPSPGGRSPALAEVWETSRTQVQVNSYLEKIALVAREIEWRTGTGNWQGAAPGSWKCSANQCGYFSTCKFGGLK
jgi:hypothetical protein